MSSVSGSYSIDWRRDPVDGTFYPEEITAEQGDVIILSGTNGRRGFYLIEIPDSNYPVTITRADYVDPGTGVLTPDGSPPTYTQVSSAPNANEYVVNYEQGIIILNSNEYSNTYSLGSRFEVAYYGLGTAMNIRNTQYIENAALNAKVSRDGSLAMTGNLNLGSQKIVSLANGTVSTDAINKGQLDTASAAVQSNKGYGVYASIGGNITISEDKYIYECNISPGSGNVSITMTLFTGLTFYFISNGNITDLIVNSQTVISGVPSPGLYLCMFKNSTWDYWAIP